ncbi:hypothetical protein GQ42DRAFT_162581 [Ramicandelaber brevisporus]|nr:hypothetical protein GQ42DRAFT_162581 [Ramicandelaber brevisporus]
MDLIHDELPNCVATRIFAYSANSSYSNKFHDAVLRKCYCTDNGRDGYYLKWNKYRHHTRSVCQSPPPKQYSLQITLDQNSRQWQSIFNSVSSDTIVHLNFELSSGVSLASIDRDYLIQLIANASLPKLCHFSFMNHFPSRPWPQMTAAILKHLPKLITLYIYYAPLAKHELLQIFSCAINLEELSVLTHLSDNDARAVAKFVSSIPRGRRKEWPSYCPVTETAVAYAGSDDSVAGIPQNEMRYRLIHRNRPLARLRHFEIRLHQRYTWSPRTMDGFLNAFSMCSWMHVKPMMCLPIDEWTSIYSNACTCKRIESLEDELYARSGYMRYYYDDTDHDTSAVIRMVPRPRYPLNLTNSGKMRSSYKKQPAGKKHHALPDWDTDDNYDSESDSNSV